MQKVEFHRFKHSIHMSQDNHNLTYTHRDTNTQKYTQTHISFCVKCMWWIKKNGQNKITMFNAYFEYGQKEVTVCRLRIAKSSSFKKSSKQNQF